MDLYASPFSPSAFVNFRTERHNRIEYMKATFMAVSIRLWGQAPPHYRLRDGDSTFLKLPGEIRNQIYSEVARDTPLIRLFEGRVVLPALGAVCRQVRKEMNGNYERDVSLDPSKPIFALVTNFNFDHLSRWLVKNSRDLNDRLEAPRLLCITSVLLSPDYTVDTLSPHESEENRNRKSALDAHNNSLRNLEHSVETWARTWEARDQRPCFDVESSGIRGLGSWAVSRGRFGGPERISSYIEAHRSGTTYAVTWKARTIHRQHKNSRSNPNGKERTGICYRGDFCHHLLLRNLAEIQKRAVGDQPTFRFVSWLESAMKMYHTSSAHSLDDSFHQLTTYKNSSLKPSMFGLGPTCGEQEVISFYQRLDRLNISRGTFEQEIEQRWDYLLNLGMFPKGTKRTLPQYMEDGRSRDGATREHGRGQVKRCIGQRKLQSPNPLRCVEQGQLRIPNPWVGVFKDDLCHDGVTHDENMALVTWMMEHLDLDE
jgi:hypothetical protein